MTKNSNKSANQKPVSKAAFVRDLPPDMPAAQVIAKAKEHGIKLTPAYVYVIRSKSSAKPNGKVARASSARAGGGRSSSQERTFVDLALQLGFARAQQLLDDTRASIQRAVLR